MTTSHTCEENGGKVDVRDPLCASHHPVVGRGDVASDDGGQCVQEYGGTVHGAVTVNVEHAHESHADDAHSHGEELTPDTCMEVGNKDGETVSETEKSI